MITSEEIEKDYEELKRAIGRSIRAKKFDEALSLIELAARISYQYLLKDLQDTALENYLNVIASAAFTSTAIEGIGDRVLFYDYFGFDNRGLTQQYLRALIHLKKEIVYILENNTGTYASNDILDELGKYPGAKVYKVQAATKLAKAKEIIEIIEKEKPSIALMHLAPWSVVASMVFASLTGIKRYQINLTDHAFWLGVSITDVSLEFRTFGYNLSLKERKIPAEKLRILPFYPIINSHEFLGLPKEINNRKIIFSGASIYKILGEDLLFLKMIKKLLDIDSELVFVFAGSGNTSAIDQFIREHNLEKQVFLIGDRKDITAVLQKVDYYVSTFPFTGALMTQLAAKERVPVFFFSTDKYKCNDLDPLFYKAGDFKSFNNVDDLIDVFKATYKDNDYLEQYGNNLHDGMITASEFAEAFDEILKGNDPFRQFNYEMDVSFHQPVMSQYLIESENAYNPAYKKLINSYLHSPFSTFKTLPSFFGREQASNFKKDKKKFVRNFLSVCKSSIKDRVSQR